MNILFQLFYANLLPIFLTAGIGYAFGAKVKVDIRSISRVVFYLFSPALVFNLVTSNQIENGEFLRMVLFTLLLSFIVGILTWIAGKFLKIDRKLLVAILLPVLIVNAGNFGLSVTSFAFGEGALAHASIFYVTVGTLGYTLGVMIASMGTASLRQSLGTLFKFPILYALVVAFTLNQFHWTLPVPIERTVELLASAAIPCMLIILGLQLQRVEWKKQFTALILATSMRLLVGPLVAIGISALLGLQGEARQAGILEAAMPSAVMNIILATEFDVEPAFVTAVVTATTLLSPLTLTPLLAYLGA